MPKNLKGGNKAKKRSNKFISQKSKQDIPLPQPNTEEQSYVAKVISCLGDKRFTIIILSDGESKNETILAHLSKTASKRQGRIVLDSIVKISLRGYENKCDILYRYDDSEVTFLIDNNIITLEKGDSIDNNIIFSNDVDKEEVDINNI